MPSIKERIKELRKEYGYTQESLAKALGLNAKSSIANYENGSNAPSDEIKLKMCKLFNCSMDYLIGKSEFKNLDDAFNQYIATQYEIDINNAIQHSIIDLVESKLPIEQIKEILFDSKDFNLASSKLKDLINKQPFESREKAENAINQLIDYINNCFEERNLYHTFMHLKLKEYERQKFYMCPVYGQISAGQPNWAEECIEGRLPIDPELMGIVNPEEHFFLRVNGESMNKIIKNGAFALIHKQDIVEDGEIAVVLVNGYDATLKKFTRQGNMIILEPQSNDDSFKTQVYDKNTSIKILGKYVGKMEINK